MQVQHATPKTESIIENQTIGVNNIEIIFMFTLLGLVVYILILALVWYGIDWLNVPQPFNKILKAILAILGVIHVYAVLVGGAGVSYYYL